jgi:DNA-binding transcriptional ArsR family regulator
VTTARAAAPATSATSATSAARGRARPRPAGATDVEAIDRTLQALAEPTRRAVVGLLRQGPQRAGDLAAALSMSRQAMSRHLRVLRHAGLIREVGAAQAHEDARARTYQLEAQPIADLHDWLGDVRAFWGTQLQSFKAQAERVARERRGER